MAEIKWTASQRAAIETIDGQVLVSAAAGSGKTAVLAERAAHLVCDLPSSERCDLEQLLVVTFTEAAAAEMRSRIAKAIRGRLAKRRGDSYLLQQLVRVDAAQISTIHAFCLQTIRQWFTHVDIDPDATVLDADEAGLLQEETLDALFGELYDTDDDAGQRFRHFVRTYADGRDEWVGAAVRRLHAFLQSVVDPEEWMTESLRELANMTVGRLREDLLDRMAGELRVQADWCRQAVGQFAARGPLGKFFADRFGHYLQSLLEWHDLARKRADYDALAKVIQGFEPMTLRGAAKVAGDEKGGPLDTLGRELHDYMKSRLLKERLLQRYAAIDLEQGLRDVRTCQQPIRTLIDLTRAFTTRYDQARRAGRQLDFTDLERLTLRLLTAPQADAVSGPAAHLRDRYRYVLVDEAQDINPVQYAILRAVCGPDSAGNPTNLFTVGDIKQSIYRFRLADPEIFRSTIDALESGTSPGRCIHLQENFRSHPRLINAVNAVFERTMIPDLEGMRYERDDRLIAGVSGEQPDDGPRVEIHLLQRQAGNGQRNDEDDGEPVNTTLLDLDVIEREAHVIACRIRQLVATASPQSAGSSVADRALRYSDIAILLRSTQYTADPMVRILRSYQIPARTDTASSFFEATEIRDMLALLDLLDNMQQDIPLAAVLRSPVLGEPFNESEMVSIRLHNRDVPFHQAAGEYAASKSADCELREKLGRFFARVRMYRGLARRLPLPDLLWRIYHDNGYLAYVGGLTGAAERRANLLHLYQRARQFATFSRQGLHRFLRFLDGLRGADRATSAPPAVQAENAVTVMTVHKAKGLEFPVVFLADAAHRFNDTDSAGNILLHRRYHIALRVIDSQARLAYPTIPHTRAADAIRLETRAEELRLLYVAMTRAKQRLIVIGSTSPDAVEQSWFRWKGHTGPLPALVLQSAANYLDWLLPAVASQPDGEALFSVTVISAEEMAAWSAEPATSGALDAESLRRYADLRPLPHGEPAAHDEEVEACLARLRFAYPYEDMTGLPAVVAASEVKRRLDFLHEPGESTGGVLPSFEPEYGARREMARLEPSLLAADARTRGIVVHRFLQYVDPTRRCDLGGLQDQLASMVGAGTFTEAEGSLVDLDALAWFFDTDLGKRLRAEAGRLRRETPFVAAFTPDLLAPNAAVHDPQDRILVRGMLDLLLVGENGLEIIDYKTDNISSEKVPDRGEAYRSQLDIYAQAATAIWRRPVTARHLVFLGPRVIRKV